MHPADFDFDEVKVVNNRPVNIWLYAKCRKYVDPDAAVAEQEAEASRLGAEVKVTGEYDGNPTGRYCRSRPRLTATRNPPAADPDWQLRG